MSDLLGQAVAVVTGRCRVTPSDVVRVDVDRQGALYPCVDAPRGLRWFRVDEHGCDELRPEEDARLPLAADIPRLQRTGLVDVLAWRPGRRIVLRLTRERSSLVMKGYRARRSEAAAHRHLIAARHLDGGAVRTPELVAHDASCESLVLKHVEAAPLALGPSAQQPFYRIGAAMRAWQDVAPAPEDLPRHDAGAELAVVDELAARLERVVARLPERWRELRAELGGLRPPLADAVVTHRDLHDGQFLQARSSLVLLDHDLLCAGDPLLDAANLLAHVKLRALQGRLASTSEGALLLGRALLDGLDRDGEDDFACRLRFYQAATFLRLALVHRLRPGWAHLADPLTCLAARCLDELART